MCFNDLNQQLVSEQGDEGVGLRVDFQRRGAFGCEAAIAVEAGCLAVTFVAGSKKLKV